MTLLWMLPVTHKVAEAQPPEGAIPMAMTEPSPPSTAFYNALVDRTSKGAKRCTVNKLSIILAKNTIPKQTLLD